MRSDPVESARFYLLGLASLHLRQKVAEAEVEWLLQRSPPVDYPAGSILFRQGEPADSALLVVWGELVASVESPEGERVVGTVGPWDVVGETALYAADQPRSATVRASRDSTALVVRPSLLHAGRANPVVAAIEYHLLHTLAHRIRVSNHTMQEAWRELEQVSDPRHGGVGLEAVDRLKKSIGGVS
jgi:CRP/FNR family transcriptional regulator, cyclic AMP receptor protein